ncbi:DLW-39 family protein [Arthrobacter flavus]|uniref:DLW-39 family protein n=1 Tax=Arthrobacter flavus TaxID=95172 RepID=A0ABW4Q2E6_9MICC
MKKLLVVAAAVASVFAYKRWQESERDRAVWRKATDTVD